MKKLSTDARLILFLCSISLLALLAYRVPHLTAWQAQARVPATGTQLQILIPLYNYPNWYAPENYIWDDIAAANSQVPITAIISPDSGPGGDEQPNDDYKTGLGHLRDAGVTIIGYVYTNEGNRSMDEVKKEVDKYDQDFNIHGIFFDRAANDSSKLNYYQELYDYVKSRANLDKVIINPSSPIDEGYISRPASDVAVIFGNDSSQWASYQPSAYVANYPANRFTMLVYGVPDVATMKSHIELTKERHIGYVYLTDDTLANPWDSLPTFWSEEVAYLATSSPNKLYLPLVIR